MAYRAQEAMQILAELLDPEGLEALLAREVADLSEPAEKPESSAAEQEQDGEE